MMHPSTMKLVDRLCAMTAQGKIEWTHGEADDSLVYDTEGYRVVLEGEPTNILLTDASGAELEKVSAADLSQTPHSDVGTYDALVATLLVDANRVARGTETAINSVLQGLDLDGDGVVDIPMEDGLVPTAAEIADHAPDMGEDTADESGAASLAEADVTDVSNAVASLADEVNQSETAELAEEYVSDVSQTAMDENAVATEDTKHAMTGLGMAGLGAAGLLKAAQHSPGSEAEHTPPVDSEPAAAEPPQSDIAEQSMTAATGFDLTSTDRNDAPLQLDPETVSANLDEQSEADTSSSGEFVPPEPGQVLSLSGLTNGAAEDTPVMAGTATTLANPVFSETPAPEPSEPIPTVEQVSELSTAAETPPEVTPPTEAEIAVASEAPAEPSVTEAVDNAPTAKDATEPDPVAEPEPSDEAPRASRFNPWI